MKILKTILVLIALCFSSAGLANQKQVACITVAVFKEARGEPDKGKRAVAQIVMNRARYKHYPDTPCKVVKQKYQFSWYQGMTPEFEKLMRGDLSGYSLADRQAYEDARQIALRAFYGLLDPIPALEKSMWFTTKDIRPDWSKKKKIAARIGNHVFYVKK